jgi:hypothetical protein
VVRGASPRDREQWCEEHRQLLDRIQRPDRLPTVQTEPVVLPDEEPDQIDPLGTVNYTMPDDDVNDHEKSPVSIMEIPHPWVVEIGL